MSIALLLNELDESRAREALTRCLASEAWVGGMLERRHFADDAAVFAAAAAVAEKLTEADWLEAFAAHPMIGDVDSLRAKYAATRSLAAGEQSGVETASETTLQELARCNREYHDRFGFIFIVSATGKTADEMLTLLKSRLHNTREAELKNAAAEQMKITDLRLQKLATSPSLEGRG